MSTNLHVVLLATFVILANSAVNLDTLRLVNLVYRHGDRSPVVTFPKYSHNISTTWPDGLGWLSNRGMKMQYSLGRFLRRRYKTYLKDRFDHTEFQIHSSNIERCLMSAYSNLAGLYPPSGDQLWNSKIPWQPIPVHTRPLPEDNMLSMDEKCPRYEEIFDASLKSSRVQKEYKDNKDFYELVSNKSGLSITVNNVWRVADTLYCDSQHNVSWPDWVNQTVFDKLHDLWGWGFELMYHGQEEAKLKGGPLLKKWIELTQQKVSGKSDFKMNAFSAHDTTVVAVMCAIGDCNIQVPPYTTTVIMELHEPQPDKYHVELYLRSVASIDPDDDTQPVMLTVPGCEFQCPLDKFLALTKVRVPVDWHEECKVTHIVTSTLPTAVDTDKFHTPFIIAVAVFSAVTVLLLGTVLFLCHKRKSSQGKDYSMN